MTEIPEHLLKRSRERRAAMGGDGDGGATDGGGASQSSESAPAQAASTTPAKAAAMPAHPAQETLPTAPPPSPMVEAYQRRRKIPFWAMPVLAALPLWAYVYQGTLSPPPAGEGPEVLGEELFATSCAGCHGAGGGGGVGPAFTGGSIYETFPDFQTHFEWVRLGSAGWKTERGDTYGANNKPVNTGMPAFTEDQLTDGELISIVLHERLLGGENPNEEDMLALEEVALLLSENEGMTLEDALAEVGVEAPEGGEGPAGGESEDTPGSDGNEAPSDGGDADQTGDAGGVGETGDSASNSGQGGGADEVTPPQSAGGDSTVP